MILRGDGDRRSLGIFDRGINVAALDQFRASLAEVASSERTVRMRESALFADLLTMTLRAHEHRTPPFQELSKCWKIIA